MKKKKQNLLLKESKQKFLLFRFFQQKTFFSLLFKQNNRSFCYFFFPAKKVFFSLLLKQKSRRFCFFPTKKVLFPRVLSGKKAVGKLFCCCVISSKTFILGNTAGKKQTENSFPKSLSTKLTKRYERTCADFLSFGALEREWKRNQKTENYQSNSLVDKLSSLSIKEF